MIITDSLNRRVQFDVNGEGLDGNDLINMQTYASGNLLEGFVACGTNAILRDTPNRVFPAPRFNIEGSDIFQSMNWTSGSAPEFVLSTAFAPFTGCGYVAADPVNSNALVLVSGPVAQWTGQNPFTGGLGEALACVRLPKGLTSIAISPGDVTNPRIDIVEIRISYVDSDPASRDFEDAVTRAKTSQSVNKIRRCSAVVQVKQGTPAAKAAYPTPDPGFAVLGAVYVPAGSNGLISPLNVRDMRYPLGAVTASDVEANQMWLGSTSVPWTLVQDSSGHRYAQNSSSSPGSVYAFLPYGGGNARLVGVGVCAKLSKGTSAVQLVRVRHGGGLPAMESLVVDLGGQVIGDGPAAGTPQFGSVADLFIASFLGQQYNSGSFDPSFSGLTGAIGSSGQFYGTPLWCNGTPGGMGSSFGQAAMSQPDPVYRFALKITDQTFAGITPNVEFVRWYYARGL